ncbi:MAG: VOC family protein [Bacteroidota bacterium]
MEIVALNIYTRHLAKQVEFYTQTLALELVRRSASRATFKVGRSLLTLVENDEFQPYHFAINIPCNQEQEALAWLKARVTILKDGSSEIQDFNFWNAKAIYFYDADKNIVEFIARKNLDNASGAHFDANALLEISEIGMPVDDIATTFHALKKWTTIERFDGSFERFCAIGDERGLFICINKNRKDWYPTGDKAHSSEFEIKLSEKGLAYQLAFKAGKLVPFVKKEN